MINRSFVDTNLFIYAYSKDNDGKNDKARNFFKNHIQSRETFISIQVINELCAWLHRNSYSLRNIHQITDEINNSFNIVPIGFHISKRAIDLKDKYKFEWWDALLLSTALENNCNSYFTEDLQHNQIIESKMKIINPLL